MRQVEVYRCWDDGTWDTGMVDIPDDTPEEDIERVAKDRTIELMADSPDLLCICGLYHVPDEDDWPLGDSTH